MSIIALIGNPNSGKTTIFNALTGAKQKVGNWPGVTVEKVSGHYQTKQDSVDVVDLPGTYSLDVTDIDVSLDEMVARNYILSQEADMVLDIIDASNLERNLYLTMQLIEMQVPVLVVVNMVDVALQKKIKVFPEKLEKLLGCPVIAINATNAKDTVALKAKVNEALQHRQVPSLKITYSAEVEKAIVPLSEALKGLKHEPPIAPRWLALRLLEGDDLASKIVQDDAIKTQAKAVAEPFEEDLDLLLADARYTLANRLYNAATKHVGRVSETLTERIDRVVLNRFLGIPIFLVVMYLMFMFTINFGNAFVDFFDQAFGAIFVDGGHQLFAALHFPTWLGALLADGIGGGIQTVATFIPIIGFLYLFLAFLEDSGYMTRAAFVMDRFMRFIGLPGKSFVPLIVGFGCNVPAIMATRTLEHRRDRLLTIAMAPFMSCGARLPVYVLFVAAFFPRHGQNIVFGLYLIGILAAVFTGLVLKKTFFKGEASPFVMELPPYHLPTVKGIFLNAWNRLKSFIIRAGKVIVPMVVVISFMNSVTFQGKYEPDNPEHSIMADIGRAITPIFHPLGLQDNNWPATVGIFTGILAKEAVIGSLNAAYAQLDNASDAGSGAEEAPVSISSEVVDALKTIPANLSVVMTQWGDPVGLDAAKDANQADVASDNDVDSGIFNAMALRFAGGVGAFAYLLFVLLYFPCTAAIGAVYQEAGRFWAIFVALWTTGLAYAVSSTFYQLATFAAHPVQSLAWVGIIACIVMGVYWLLCSLGKKETLLFQHQPR